MLEFFIAERLCSGEGNSEDEQKETFIGGREGLELVAFAIAGVSAYLAYHKNAGESEGMRVLITLLAFLFSQLYLLYYVIRYVIVENLNGGKKGKGSGKGR